MDFAYKFAAVKGFQANRDYYIAMVPLNILSKLFREDEEYILPEYRSQRSINEFRIPEIRDYILNNRNNYVFSALSASIDGEFMFISSELNDLLGVLEVSMSAVFMINDGQHRKASIEAALKEDPSLENETIAIVFFKDEGLKRSQQMFADLNKHAIKSTMSLSTLYDDRDDLGNAVKDVIKNNPFLNKYIDKEKDTLGKNAFKLYTLANFVRANERIISQKDIVEKDKEFLNKYWKTLIDNIPEWDMLEKKRITKMNLREEYILTLAVTMKAWGRLGSYFYDHQEKMDKLLRINTVDWLRTNIEWHGRVINDSGKIVNNQDAEIKMCNLIKMKLGIKLTKEEKVKENDIKK